MKHVLSFAIFVSCVVLGVACASSSAKEPEVDGPLFSRPMEEQHTLEYRACATASDCVLAQNGCCDCANGGEDIAIHRDQVRAFNARFDCHGCTEVAGECGQGAITCENKLCTYREPGQ